MINNNKILTVSYGTFSCTLEGFDDSFGTMKAIAEYFRGLASEDRYFGAEPPQPDAEMLARIAQKEISRRVEAREHEGKIVLSAMEDEAAPAVLEVAQQSAPPAADPAKAPAAETAIAAAAALAVSDDAPAAAPSVSTQEQTDADQDAPQVAEAHPSVLEAVAPEAPVVEKPAVVEPAAEAPGADTPDAQAPQTIAAQHIAAQHSVAQVEDEGVEPVEPRATQATAPAAQQVEDDIDIVPGQPDADVEAFFENSKTEDADLADDTIAALADPVAAVDPAPPTESIAAKLQRIRAVVAQHDDDADADDFSEDEHANRDAPEAAAQDAVAAARRDIEEALDADEAAEDGLQADEEVDEITSILNRMANEDTQSDGFDEVDDALAAFDAAANTQEPEAAEPKAEPTAETAALDRADNLFEAPATAADPSGDAADTVQDATLANAAQVVASQELRLEPAPAPAPASPKLPRARVIKVKRADLEAAIQSGELEEYEDDADDAPLALDDLAPARTTESSLSPEDQDDLARELAELEADIEMEQAPAPTAVTAPSDAIDADVSDDVADDRTEAVSENLADALLAEHDLAEHDLAEDNFAEGDLSENDISENDAANQLDDDSIIASALADIQDTPASTEHVEDAEPVEQAEQVTPAPAAAARAKLPSIDEEGQSEDMARLMAEAENQMGEPEGATRRDAFAHLRAAVAAKKADEALGSKDETVRGDDAYRDDLADVVRPRRPVSGEGRTKRPGEGRPAPLKLVAEQRINAPAAQPAASGPVRPRRVAAQSEPAPQVDAEGRSFADYATEMGATKLPELLEAAASYMAFVEGRDQFSRPQLMTKVRQAGPDGFSREDTLRSFGKLLREGKIEKIKAGRFAASEDIGFRPKQRAAG